MPYAVKEIFFTLQGEGAQSGRAAVFCRFAGCNLWNGLEKDRAQAVCNFCDTDFIGTNSDGGKFATAANLADAVVACWEGGASRPLVVCTGGEPLLQLDAELIAELHKRNVEIAVETNGSLPAPDGIDWICVSPKADVPLAIVSGNELKLVYPQEKAQPERFKDLKFDHFFLQPMDGPKLQENTALTVEYCLRNPQWRLSLQTHKVLGLR